MQNEAEPLGALARAILDGAPVDWAVAETGADPATRVLIRQLRSLEGVAAVHRRDLDVPEYWSHLRILECIGRGAFGAVYRARDSRLDRDVALKLLPAPEPSSDNRPSSIIEEGRLLARVRHANVVTIHGAEQIGDQIGLWMELVSGQTLEQVLQDGAVLTPAEVIDIGLELCGAVSAVHGAGLLHRDIKANNVTRADDGRIVLMDFGAGRDLVDSSSSDLTGTPLYLAPEVLRGEPATVQSDLYSLGVLLYRLLTNRYPVQGRTIGDLRLAHERNEHASLRDARPDLDESVIRVVERAIDFAPGRRYASADALKAGLLALKAGPRTTWWWPAVAAFGVLVLSALAWDVWSRPGGMERAGVHGLPARPTIAVLPFKNEGGQASEEFVDGLTYEIQKNLAAIDGLELRSPMSSFAFKNQRRDLADIGSRLDVGLVLEGSVFVAGEQLRVNARLTNVADNVALWAETFDRHGKDVFAIQNDIASAIVNKLRLKLGQGQRRYETTPDVYYLFLSARGFQIKGSPENATRAVDLFEQVVAEDPAYVPAWAGLASALGMLARLTQTPDLPPLDPRMEAAALRAIQSDPMSAEAQAAMGSLYARKRNWAESEASFQKAMALNPSLTTTHTDFVLSTLMPLGRLDDAVRVLEAARRADPESLDVRRALAHVQVEAGQYDAAIASCRWVMERNPKFPYIESWLGRALMLEGRTDEALAVFQRGNPNRCAYLGYHLAVTGPRAEAEALAATCEPRGQLMIYGGLGDKDRAFEALELLAEENWWRAATWMRRPELALLRGDPRFDAIKKRLGLPQ